MTDEPHAPLPSSESHTVARWRHPIVVAVAGLGIILAGWMLWRSARSTPLSPSPAPLPVIIATADRRPFAITLDAPATITPLATVTVRSQTNGVLRSVEFREGDDVHAGEILARVDARPLQALAQQARADLAREQARLRIATIQHERAVTLNDRGFASLDTVDAKRADLDQVRAAVDAARGGVAGATVQLAYSVIRSPINGRVGFRLTDAGSLVSATERTPIAVVVQQRPIAAVFALPQRDLPAIVDGLKRGLAVTLSDARGGKAIARGRVATIDNVVDAGSGTFQVKATFANADAALWPGQFVQARVAVRTLPHAVVIPAQALQNGPAGPFVFVVDAGGRAQIRRIDEAGNANGLAMIGRGLSPGDRVIVDGQYGMRPGARVHIAGRSTF